MGSPPFRLVAIGAKAEELVDMANQTELVIAANLHLAFLDLFIDEFDDPATFDTDHVVVVPLRQFILVAEASIPHIHLADKADIFENIQRPVYGGAGNPDALSPKG